MQIHKEKHSITKNVLLYTKMCYIINLPNVTEIVLFYHTVLITVMCSSLLYDLERLLSNITDTKTFVVVVKPMKLLQLRNFLVAICI